MSYGQKSRLGISFQDSYGTALQDSVYWIPKLSEDVGLMIPPLVEQNLRGVLDEGAHYAGPKTAAGTISMEAAPIPLGVMLQAAMGAPSTVNSGSLYTHTFKPRTSDWDEYTANAPLTVEKYMDTGSSNLFYDMCANTLELRIAQGEFMQATLGLVGGKFSQQAATAASYPAVPLWTWDVTSVSVGGTAKGEIMDATISMEESIEAQHTLNNSVYPSRNKRTGFRVLNVSGTLKFDNATEYQEFLDQSERELIAHFEGTTAVQSGYNNSLTIKVPLLRHVEFKPAAGGPGELEVGFTSKGVYSATSATALQVILANGQAAY